MPGSPDVGNQNKITKGQRLQGSAAWNSCNWYLGTQRPRQKSKLGVTLSRVGTHKEAADRNSANSTSTHSAEALEDGKSIPSEEKPQRWKHSRPLSHPQSQIQVLGTQVLIQFLLRPWERRKARLKCWGLLPTNVGDLDKIPGCWLQFGSALVAWSLWLLWRENQRDGKANSAVQIR